MTYDPREPNKQASCITDRQMQEIMASWTADMRKAALAEGWDLWDSRGSAYGPVQVQRIDSPEEFEPPCPALNSDDDAIRIVMRGQDLHHSMARCLVKQWNPEDYWRMVYLLEHPELEAGSRLKWFQVQITIPIRAESASEATAIGLGACEHLHDTFNDNGSIGSEVRVEVVSAAGPGNLKTI